MVMLGRANVIPVLTGTVRASQTNSWESSKNLLDLNLRPLFPLNRVFDKFPLLGKARVHLADRRFFSVYLESEGGEVLVASAGQAKKDPLMDPVSLFYWAATNRRLGSPDDNFRGLTTLEYEDVVREMLNAGVLGDNPEEKDLKALALRLSDLDELDGDSILLPRYLSSLCETHRVKVSNKAEQLLKMWNKTVEQLLNMSEFWNPYDAMSVVGVTGRGELEKADIFSRVDNSFWALIVEEVGHRFILVHTLEEWSGSDAYRQTTYTNRILLDEAFLPQLVQ